jgi:opacity protein-like surface antigen
VINGLPRADCLTIRGLLRRTDVEPDSETSLPATHIFGGTLQHQHIEPNAQDGHMVCGFEGDVSFGEVDASANVFSKSVSLNTDLFATIRGRVGVAADYILLYGTAGLAILDGDISRDFSGPTPSFTAVGGVVGAGAELAINQDVSQKAEFLYAIFDEIVDLGGGDEFDIDNFYTVRFCVNWHF